MQRSGEPHSYGSMNAHVVGSLMKEAVRRAIVAIRGERFTFEASEKGRTRAGSPDMVTSADHAAQRVYVKLLGEWFPTYGIVAEEDSLRVPCTDSDCDRWFTVDPLDGTKAFIRRQSHGVGTMIALIEDRRVVAACVGDVMTQEVYAVRPHGTAVHRISEFGIGETLHVDESRTLSEQWMLLRGHAGLYSPALQALVAPSDGLMGGYEIMNGSIGLGVARLWKGELGGAVIPAGELTPWDVCPLDVLSRTLGFVFLQLDDGGDWVEVELPLGLSPSWIERETWVLHRSRVPELRAWWAERRQTGTRA